VGVPEEVYNRPVTLFAREFLGKTFSLPGRVVQKANGKILVKIAGVEDSTLTVMQSDAAASGKAFSPEQEVTVAIRPERIVPRNNPPARPENTLGATIAEIQFMGDHYECTVALGKELKMLTLPVEQVFSRGDRIFLEFPPNMMSLWSQASS
jgi:putrescine transport system ATP-binding protein